MAIRFMVWSPQDHPQEAQFPARKASLPFAVMQTLTPAAINVNLDYSWIEPHIRLNHNAKGSNKIDFCKRIQNLLQDL